MANRRSHDRFFGRGRQCGGAGPQFDSSCSQCRVAPSPCATVILLATIYSEIEHGRRVVRSDPRIYELRGVLEHRDKKAMAALGEGGDRDLEAVVLAATPKPFDDVLSEVHRDGKVEQGCDAESHAYVRATTFRYNNIVALGAKWLSEELNCRWCG